MGGPRIPIGPRGPIGPPGPKRGMPAMGPFPPGSVISISIFGSITWALVDISSVPLNLQEKPGAGCLELLVFDFYENGGGFQILQKFAGNRTTIIATHRGRGGSFTFRLRAFSGFWRRFRAFSGFGRPFCDGRRWKRRRGNVVASLRGRRRRFRPGRLGRSGVPLQRRPWRDRLP